MAVRAAAVRAVVAPAVVRRSVQFDLGASLGDACSDPLPSKQPGKGVLRQPTSVFAVSEQTVLACPVGVRQEVRRRAQRTRPERVAALGVAVAAVAPGVRRQVPTVASGGTPSCQLFVLELGRMVAVSPDVGSSVTLMTEEFRVRNSLPLSPLVGSEPVALGQADGEGHSSMKVLGATPLQFHIPGTSTVLAVRVLVVAGLFTPFLLGRNVTDAIDEAYGRPSAWSKDGVAVPLRAGAGNRLAAGVPVVLGQELCSVATPMGRTSKQEQVQRLVLYVQEADLRGATGDRVEELSGFFDHDGQRTSALVPAAVVSARVDWSEAGRRGSRRRLFLAVDVQAVVDGGGDSRVLLKEGTRMGTFYFGRPVVAAATAQAGSGVASIAGDLVARTLERSTLLQAEEDRQEVAEVVALFKLTEDLPEAGLALAEPFHIRLKPGAVPFARRNYGMSQADEEFAERQITAWLKNGNIVESRSPWSSPILVAHHPRTGKPRFCVDYRALNALTVNDSYLLPRVEDITRAAHVNGARVFSKIDLSQGFTQTPIHADSQDYTSFRGPRHGMFKFAGGCFGLRNMPPAFQRLMDRVLGDMLWHRACVYVDDVLVFTKSVKEHHLALRELARRFADFNIYVRASKCDLYRDEVEFLGYYLSENGLRVMPDRVAGVINVAVPASKEELRIFMGLANQFRHLVHNYAEVAAPLEAMKHPQSKTPFDLKEGSVGRRAFQDLKLELVKMPTLMIPDMNLPFTFWCDASEVAMSFVLCQERDGVLGVVGFYSKAFSGNDVRLPIPIKEAKALHHFAMGRCHKFLSGPGPHTGYVDSLSSGAVAKQTIKDMRLLRYAVDLGTLNLELHLVPGKQNPADPSTRPPFIQADPHLTRLKEEGERSPLCDNPGWMQVAAAAERARQSELAGAATAAVAAAVLIRPDGTNASDAEMAAHQQLDPYLAELVAYITDGRPPSSQQGISKDEARRRIRCSAMSAGLVVTDTGVLVRVTSVRGSIVVQTVIPGSQREGLLRLAHTSSHRNGVHVGRDALSMLQHLQQFAWWWTMRGDCFAFECAACNIARRPPVKPGGLLHSTVAGRPGAIVSIDWVPAPEDGQGYKGYFLMCDKFSGVATCYPAKLCNTATALEAFDQMVLTLFLDVERVIADSASIFHSEDFRKGMKTRGVSHALVAPVQHQQANFVERTVQVVKAMLRTTLDGIPTQLWRRSLPDILRCYNMEVSDSRGASPIHILTGWQPSGLPPYAATVKHRNQGGVFNSREELWKAVTENLSKAQAVQAHHYNLRHVDRRFVEGDIVRHKVHRPDGVDGNFNLGAAYSPDPFVVIAQLSEVSYIIQSLERPAHRQTLHVSDLIHAVLDREDPVRVRAEAAVEEGHEIQYVVQRIHAHRQVAPPPHERDYLVQWGGWRNKSSFTWEPRSVLVGGAADILRAYEEHSGLL